jgi:hypothetical protein
LEIILQFSLVNPFANLVSHIMYYGPIICVIILLWKKIVNISKETGLAFPLILFLYVMMAVGTESRQSINALPIFVILATEALNEVKVSWRFVYGFVFLSLLTSRFWLKINIAPWGLNDFMNFPQQMYFMSQGPWMSTQSYRFFFVVSALLMIGVFFMMRFATARADIQRKIV